MSGSNEGVATVVSGADQYDDGLATLGSGAPQNGGGDGLAGVLHEVDAGRRLGFEGSHFRHVDDAIIGGTPAGRARSDHTRQSAVATTKAMASSRLCVRLISKEVKPSSRARSAAAPWR